ncbi:MAG: hypothetical protein RML36_00110 [Anaerolineae bacterium]|nr:hypothetical protein [Anaerolineae bacterium]MDW8097871.1 hypothetical protein [Anaerolineae bacterium]
MRRSQVFWSASLAAALILAAAGYWGPWVSHRAAALVIPGLDLAEYVKFLPEYRDGRLRIVREGFYLPLLTLSLALSTLSWRGSVRWPTGLRAIGWLASISTALAMLPPAWSPAVLRLSEFRLQVVAIGLCLVWAIAVPLWCRRRVAWLVWTIAALSLAAVVIPIVQFLTIRPALDRVYGRPIAIGWGPGVMAIGLALLAVSVVNLEGVAKIGRVGRKMASTRPKASS